MWTDIDYMASRRVFTLDLLRFPLEKMTELVNYLHKHNQHYIVMVDPAISDIDNEAYNHGRVRNVILSREENTIYEDYGVDIDGLWIDMNEASNFCAWPYKDPFDYAQQNNLPPVPPPARQPPRPLPGFPNDFQPQGSLHVRRSSGLGPRDNRDTKGQKIGLPSRDLIEPQYQIANAAGSLSNKTIDTDLVHLGKGYTEYDTHNLYGTMMSSASREAMLQRRPQTRPLVIARSTFAGAGAHVGHWLGDNRSQWDQCRISISQMLQFASIFQIPMVGSDICGFGGNAAEELCARWTTLGAFNPFYRNHNEIQNIPQEFYRWPTVADAARKILNIRYRLLDYLYTSFHRQSETGEPFLQPLFYIYPNDMNTFSNEAQFFYGNALLISPVQGKGQTSVNAYFPSDFFYDWYTGQVIHGEGKTITLSNVGITEIPIHIRGGFVLPLRSEGASTTSELRRKGFEIVVAPNRDGYARGQLYLDDGESIHPANSSMVDFEYGNGQLRIRGEFGYHEAVLVKGVVTLLGQRKGGVSGGVRRGNSSDHDVSFDADRQVLKKQVHIELTAPTVITF
ncbi:Glycoside hydrolase family 31 [Penicillium angulare]|uniref:Glycoside hydrolase family 31 n=1 Tax=Penicillium angulare TaxID=116970 RepID=UPI00253F8F34|nr:Glycoside hydrolase family 31 [Penicillium angulare]KAJ5259271.1 Glycoside hydrolase family 31 [Penicillium angulare]